MKTLLFAVQFLMLAFCQSALAEFVTCESLGHDRQSCHADTKDGVRLIRQESKSDCIRGITWDYDDRAIWVSDGCRAVFEVSGTPRGALGYGLYGEAPPAAKLIETCPEGFTPSERKCTTEERRHGCKDMRLPGGLGCVHR